MQNIKIFREFGTGPIWIKSGLDDIYESSLPESLPISTNLLGDIKRWNQVFVDYFNVMEKIPGGGWSHHTQEDFEAAKNELRIEFPTKSEDDELKFKILQQLRDELNPQEYSIEITDKFLNLFQ